MRDVTKSLVRDVTKSLGGSIPGALGPLSLSPASLVTIRMQEIYRSLSANYTRLLNDIVFSRGISLIEDRKIVKSFSRILQNDEANLVLSILWRESSYVTENEL